MVHYINCHFSNGRRNTVRRSTGKGLFDATMAASNTQSNIQRRESVAAKVAHGAADMTRRMVCGGLAGMIAKVRSK